MSYRLTVRKVIAILIVFFTVLLLILCPDCYKLLISSIQCSEDLYQDMVRGRPAVINAKSTKIILAWTKVYNKDFLIYRDDKVQTSWQAFEQCPTQYRDCEWTIDRSQLNRSDAVIFHFYPGDFSLSDLPKHRSPSQQWVNMNLQPPSRFKDGSLKILDGLFNLTATYEDDADVTIPYGYYTKRLEPLQNFLPENTKRTRSVLWVVDQCYTLSRREIYADDLKLYIDIDVYGKCGKPLPQTSIPNKGSIIEQDIAKNYYFYLAFENSDCLDYVTDEFWNSLRLGLVPIVRGQFPRYEKHVPPGSYINADVFFSYKDLADYLKHLIAHPKKYEQYFHWRKWYSIPTTTISSTSDLHCQLCRLLQTAGSDNSKMYNLSKRYSAEERCFSYHKTLQNKIIGEERRVYGEDEEFRNFLSFT